MSLPQPPDTDADPAVKLIAVLAAKKRLEALEGRLRAEVGLMVAAGERIIPSIDAGPANVELGNIVRAKQTYTVRIEDPEAFLAWAKEFYPHEVEVIPEVVVPEHVVPEQRTPGWEEVRATLLGNCRRSPLGSVVGPQGEVGVPGLIVTVDRAPSMRVTPNQDAVAEVWPLLSAVFRNTVMTELEAGE